MDNLGVVFTNTTGQIIYANDVFTTMMQLASKGTAAWRYLNEVLGIPNQIMASLLEQVAHSGELQDIPLEVQTQEGHALPVRGWGQAFYDAAGKFTGMEMRLEFEEVPTYDADYQPLSDSEKLHLYNYFTDQIHILRELISQIGGRPLQDNFDEVINSCARYNGWSIGIEQGSVTGDLNGNHAEIYSALLSKAVAYTAEAVGLNLIKRKLDQTDSVLDDQVFAFVTRCGLRDLYLDF